MSLLKVKIFTHCTTNINPPGELQINAWLAQHTEVRIEHLLQSESMAVKDGHIERNLSISVLYREGPAAGGG